MKNKFIGIVSKIIIIIAIIVSIIFLFFVYSNAQQKTSGDEKIDEEIKYLDTKLLTVINYLNNIDLQNYKVILSKVESQSDSSSSSAKEEEQSSQQEDSSENGTDKEETTITKMEEETIVTDGGEVDWKTIEGELEVLYSTWSSVILDLYSTGVNSENILSFSNTLDDTLVNVKKQDKALTAMYFAKLYAHLPLFLENAKIDEVDKKSLEAKSYIINAYAFAETENWDRMGQEITKAEGIFEGLVNDAKYVNDDRKYNINKTYIVIEELKNSLDVKEKGIFYVKYKNVLEELNIVRSL